MKSSVLAEPIRVGRETELGELQRYVHPSIEGKGTVVFVSGEAGSGKTRLTNEFLNYAKDNGITVLLDGASAMSLFHIFHLWKH